MWPHPWARPSWRKKQAGRCWTLGVAVNEGASGKQRQVQGAAVPGGLDDEEPVPGSWSAGRRDEQQRAAELEPVRSWRREGGRRRKEGVWSIRSEAGEREEVKFVAAR